MTSLRDGKKGERPLPTSRSCGPIRAEGGGGGGAQRDWGPKPCTTPPPSPARRAHPENPPGLAKTPLHLRCVGASPGAPWGTPAEKSPDPTLIGPKCLFPSPSIDPYPWCPRFPKRISGPGFHVFPPPSRVSSRLARNSRSGCSFRRKEQQPPHSDQPTGPQLEQIPRSQVVLGNLITT